MQYRWTNGEVDKMLIWHDLGKDYRYIASQLGRSEKAVECKLLSIISEKCSNDTWTPREDRVILEMKTEDYMIENIAQKLRRPVRLVQKRLNHLLQRKHKNDKVELRPYTMVLGVPWFY